MSISPRRGEDGAPTPLVERAERGQDEAETDGYLGNVGSMCGRVCVTFILTVLFVAAFTAIAAAHPHVWVTARAQVIFDAKGATQQLDI
jgi:hypothetical protein